MANPERRVIYLATPSETDRRFVDQLRHSFTDAGLTLNLTDDAKNNSDLLRQATAATAPEGYYLLRVPDSQELAEISSLLNRPEAELLVLLHNGLTDRRQLRTDSKRNENRQNHLGYSASELTPSGSLHNEPHTCGIGWIRGLHCLRRQNSQVNTGTETAENPCRTKSVAVVGHHPGIMLIGYTHHMPKFYTGFGNLRQKIYRILPVGQGILIRAETIQFFQLNPVRRRSGPLHGPCGKILILGFHSSGSVGSATTSVHFPMGKVDVGNPRHVLPTASVFFQGYRPYSGLRDPGRMQTARELRISGSVMRLSFYT